MNLNKRALNGVINLSLLKAIDYIVPLLVIPYVIHVLGLDYYGEYAYVQVIAIFFAFFCDYSLPTVAVQSISRKKNRKYINTYISTIIISKSIVVILISTIYIFICFLMVDKFDFMLMFGLFVFLGLAFQNAWLYQAYEVYKPLIIFSGISRLLCLITVPMFVLNESDGDKFLFIQSLMYFFPGILSVLYISFKFNIRRFKIIYLYHVISNGFYVFQYRVINAAVLPINNQVIFLLADAQTLAVYNLIMKGLSALVNFMNPISLSVQPILSEFIDRRGMLIFFNGIKSKILIISLFSTAFLFLSLVFYLNYYSLDGIDWFTYILVFTLCITLIPHALNGLLSQTLNIFGCSKYVRNVILFFTVITLLLLPLSVYYIGAYFVGILNVFMYYMIFIFMLYKIRREFAR
ncbi:oligosaccharide flippase family protein [Aliivibrio fischeri]|uniref:oligosaccharide flippase family protein n=1 Tax=Aliivibrio fischeri TaxID=668 RepID=UPI0012DAEF85|nr:oligosaccharide flippase family protein [Aliivibrio fischeri]MUK65335.1 oligosaccharide flippase family protein [Aliivibrio fischeri]